VYIYIFEYTFNIYIFFSFSGGSSEEDLIKFFSPEEKIIQLL